MPITSPGVRDKVAVSSLVPALHHLSASSALPLPVLASPLVKVVVAALLIVVPITASGFTLATAMIATMTMPTHMLDSLVFKASEEPPVASASLVPLTPGAPDLKPLSASSTLAAELAVALNLLLTSTVNLLFAVRRVVSV